jgi:P27 family predicted phage terminase small subunit
MFAETLRQTTRMSKTAQKPTQNGKHKGGRPRKRPTDPPSDLDAKSKQFWKRTLDQLSTQGTWQDSDIPALERYVRACEQARHSRAKIPAEGTTKGSQGQLVEHPAIKTAREAERDAHKYATDLLLTPSARRKAAIESADAGDALPPWLAD